MRYRILINGLLVSGSDSLPGAKRSARNRSKKEPQALVEVQDTSNGKLEARYRNNQEQWR